MVERVLAHWQSRALEQTRFASMCVRQFLLPLHGQQHAEGYCRYGGGNGASSGHSLAETTLHSFMSQSNPLIATVFHQLTPFDHNNAVTQIACEPPPPIDLLVLKVRSHRTRLPHRLLSRNTAKFPASNLQQALNLVQEASYNAKNPLRTARRLRLALSPARRCWPFARFTAPAVAGFKSVYHTGFRTWRIAVAWWV